VLSMSAQYVHHEVNMPLTYILTSSFQFLFPDSRLMTSWHVMCHVTIVMCLFIIQKEKENQNQKKRIIKSRKIDKNQNKLLVFKCTITIWVSISSTLWSVKRLFIGLIFLHLKNLIACIIGMQIASPIIYHFLNQVLVNTLRWSYLSWI